MSSICASFLASLCSFKAAAMRQGLLGRGASFVLFQIGFWSIIIALIVCFYAGLQNNEFELFHRFDTALPLKTFARERAANDTKSTSAPRAPLPPPGTYKVVLLWTKWFGDRNWTRIFDAQPLSPFITPLGDTSKKCLLTIDRTQLGTADALVFHGPDLNFIDLPYRGTRRVDHGSPQKFVFFMMESPVHSRLTSRWQMANGVGFNWIMSYALSADVQSPYGRLFPNVVKSPETKAKLDKKIDDFVQSFPKRKTDAVWIVSNCVTQGHRERIVAKLKENGISVDIKGACSTDKPDTEWGKTGVEGFYSRYRFYLSFENSICDDYVTEKAFNGYNASQFFGLVPIVYGGANYTALLPPGSYIDAQKFASVKDLATFMTNLTNAQNADNLRRFFQWQYDLKMFDDGLFRVRNGWGNLCKKLWESSTADINDASKQAFVTDLEGRLGFCHDPPPALV